MITYKLNDKEFKMKSKPSEITLKEFSKIINLNNVDGIEYYLQSFEVLGLKDEMLDILDIDSIFEIIKDFNTDFVLDKEFKTSFELNGFNYISTKTETFTLNARKLAKIESKFNTANWPIYAMAVIFEREDLSKKEHNDEAHIKYKMELFQDLSIDLFLPYIYYIAENYVKNIKLLINE